jgi:hypothetical protein
MAKLKTSIKALALVPVLLLAASAAHAWPAWLPMPAWTPIATDDNGGAWSIDSHSPTRMDGLVYSTLSYKPPRTTVDNLLFLAIYQSYDRMDDCAAHRFAYVWSSKTRGSVTTTTRYARTWPLINDATTGRDALIAAYACANAHNASEHEAKVLHRKITGAIW